ncbi:hypothetical protein JHK85_007215 [Glycine max]|nr:hypothetical protein JHK85_007215 [Glycine max]
MSLIQCSRHDHLIITASQIGTAHSKMLTNVSAIEGFFRNSTTSKVFRKMPTLRLLAFESHNEDSKRINSMFFHLYLLVMFSSRKDA